MKGGQYSNVGVLGTEGRTSNRSARPCAPGDAGCAPASFAVGSVGFIASD